MPTGGVGQLFVSLGLDAAEYLSGLTRAEHQANEFGRKLGSGIRSAAGLATAALGAVGLSAGGIVAGFTQAIKAAGDFQDIAEQVGSSAEELASLAVAAGTAGTEMSTIAAASVQLTKRLTDTKDASTDTGAAVKALGIDLQSLKAQSSAQQLETVAKALGGFEDGAGKTAVAVALLGKSGAQLLPFLNELGSGVGRVNILTAEQIELADAYADQQARLTTEIGLYASAAATQETVRDYIRDLVDTNSKQSELGANTGVRDFADKAVRALGFVVDAVDGVIRVFAAVGTTIGAAAAQAAAVASGEFKQAIAIGQDWQRQMAELANRPLFSQRLNERLEAARAAPPPTPTGAPATRPRLTFEGAEDKERKAKAVQQSEAERYLETLQKQAEKVRELSTLEQAQADISAGRIKGLNAALEAQILAQAKANDAAARAKAFRDAEVETTTRLAKADLERTDELVKGNKALQDEIDLIGASTERQGQIEERRVRDIRLLKEQERATRAANGAKDETLQQLDAEIEALKRREELIGERTQATPHTEAERNARDAGDATRSTLADSIEQGILDGFRNGRDMTDIFLDELKAQFAKTVLRPLIQPVADANNKLIEMLVGAAASYFAGGAVKVDTTGVGINPGGEYRPSQGYAQGLPYVPHDDFPARLHRGERVLTAAENARGGFGNGGGSDIVINNYGAKVQTRRSRSGGRNMLEVVVEAAKDAVSDDVMSGGRLDRSFSQQYGLNRARGLAR
jgi:hypothetical protein